MGKGISRVGELACSLEFVDLGTERKIFIIRPGK